MEAEARRDPGKVAAELFERLGSVPLLLDEFSIFLRAAVTSQTGHLAQLLAILASRRRAGSPQVLAGSAGLSSYVAFHGLGPYLQDVESEDLPPLDPQEGRILAEELLYGAGLRPTAEALEGVLEVLGEPVPYFVHALVQELADDRPAGPVTAEAVREVYEERLLGTEGNRFFNAFQLRTPAYPQELWKGAERILTRVAQSAAGLDRETLETEYRLGAAEERHGDFPGLFACLQEDYDLVEQDGLWRIRCKVIRDRWRLAEPWLTGDR
jgi:hypothetical protein